MTCPREPVGNLDGAPVTEYLYASYNLNEEIHGIRVPQSEPGYQRGRCAWKIKFFYEELVPPFIDVLGGANFRPSKTTS